MSMSDTELGLRETLSEALKTELESICAEMSCEPPSVTVTADLSEIVRLLPRELATAPTVRCHRVPCVAVTSKSWMHLMDVCAKSEAGVRHIALEVGLSRKDEAMTLESVTVKSRRDFAVPTVSPASGQERKFSFNQCGVTLSLDTSEAFVVDVGGHRLGIILEGKGQLRLKPTCAKSRRMLVDFVPEPDQPVDVSRIFITCPFTESEGEPSGVNSLRRQIVKTERAGKRDLKRPASESLTEFLSDCVNSAYPLSEEDLLQGLTPVAGYEHPIVVVQTDRLGVFGFCFALAPGLETVMMTSAQTQSPVSYWESSGTQHDWTIPKLVHSAFDVTWLPDRRRLALICKVSVSGVTPGKEVRFILNSVCKVRSCQINGERTPFVQGKLALADSISSALACGYHPMFIDGFVQLSVPKTTAIADRAEVSIEYNIDYTDSRAIETIGMCYFCEDCISLDGHYQWFPFTRWGDQAPWAGTMDFRAVVPRGFTAIAQGNPEPPETRDDTTVWRYTTDFPTTLPSLTIGKFEELVDDEFETKLSALTHAGGEVVRRRWLDALSLTVAWAEKYCGSYPYKRFTIVQTLPGDPAGGVSWPTMLVMNRMVNPSYLWWQLSHEVSHQWWGDAARMLDIDDVWLHEGTAVYFNMLFNEDLNMRKPGIASFKRAAVWIRQFGATPPISAGFRMGPRCASIIYSVKGAYLYHILRMATNDDRRFFATLKQFQQEGQKVGLAEVGLRTIFEKAIGHDLSDFFRLYVHSGDLPGVQVEVTDVTAKGDRATVSLSAQITPSGYQLPYPIDVYPKSGQAPHREVIFIGPDFGDYRFEVPFADVSRVVGNPEAMLLVADADQEDVELYP